MAVQGMREYTGENNDGKILKQYLVKNKIYSCKSTKSMPQQDQNYDTQLHLTGIYNHASASMTNCKMDFIDTSKQANLHIKGMKGRLST
jgi:hypothetical protein